MNHKIIRQETKRYHQTFVINATISNSAIHTVTIRVVSKLSCRQGCQKWLWVLVEELFFWIPARDGRSTNLYTKSETLTLTCSVNWACSEKVNLYSRQIMKDKNTCNIDCPLYFETVSYSPHHYRHNCLSGTSSKV